MQDSYMGKRIKCPNCKMKFVVGGQQDIPESTPVREPKEYLTPERMGDEGEYERCPYCSELIRRGARKCKHCGEFLAEQLRMQRQRLLKMGQEEKKVPLAWWFLALIPIWIIGLVLGILAVTQKRRNGVLFLVLAITVLPFVGYLPIAIVAAMAIPSLERARSLANESFAISTLKTFCTSMEMFRARNGNYPEDINQLKEDHLFDPGVEIEDNSFENAGYIFTYYPYYKDKEIVDYVIIAEPQTHAMAGRRILSVKAASAVRVKEPPFESPSDYETAKELYESSHPEW